MTAASPRMQRETEGTCLHQPVGGVKTTGLMLLLHPFPSELLSGENYQSQKGPNV